jgi:hypothetical protein
VRRLCHSAALADSNKSIRINIIILRGVEKLMVDQILGQSPSDSLSGKSCKNQEKLLYTRSLAAPQPPQHLPGKLPDDAVFPALSHVAVEVAQGMGLTEWGSRLGNAKKDYSGAC